ncbi:MAG: hypothetical protein ISS71_07220 [Phycisphaerae bacterium]|nr:hypothetical protein [Phycisphaerae bacterium]
MNHKKENLEQLLQRFMDEAHARQMADDIGHADYLFDTHPAPSVSRETIRAIKQNTQIRFRRNEHIPSKMKWFAAAVVVAAILIGLFIRPSNDENSPSSFLNIVQNNRIRLEGFYTADASTAEIENEITHLLEAIEAIDMTPYEPVNTLQLNLIQIENELTTDSTEFWKG